MRVTTATFGLVFTVFPLSTAWAIDDQQFDLQCTGTVTKLNQAPAPWSATFVIDLARREFCFKGCKQSMQIAEIQPGMLVLEDEPPSYSFDQDKVTVSRTTGDVVKILSKRGAFFDLMKGSCQKVPFSGLPEKLF